MEQARVDVVETNGIGKRYGSFWALKNCSITVPRGSISALVGPNGAGKTTLLKILASLSTPTTGNIEALGQTPSQEGVYVSKIGYLAQEIPLYEYMSVQDHLKLGVHLNRQWDMAFARAHLSDLSIPLDRRVGKLSGGQRAQVGLTLALAKKPQLLILDEPVASLDPLAREDFLTSLTEAVHTANGSLSVILSSHLLGDLERVCDHLMVLAAGEAQLCDYTENILETHRILIGPTDAGIDEKAFTIIQEIRADRQATLLVRLNKAHSLGAAWRTERPTIEEIILGYMKQARQSTTNQKGSTV